MLCSRCWLDRQLITYVALRGNSYEAKPTFQRANLVLPTGLGKTKNFEIRARPHAGHSREEGIKEGRRLPVLVDEKANASPDADTALLKHRSLSSYMLVPGQFPDPLNATSVSAPMRKRKENQNNCWSQQQDYHHAK